jgi:hypothetical protein
MTELNVLDGQQTKDTTTAGDAGSARMEGGSCPVTGVGRRMEGAGAPDPEADEPGQHPNRVDGSENPESGDALLENHENGVWNKEREAEAIEERENAGGGERSRS